MSKKAFGFERMITILQVPPQSLVLEECREGHAPAAHQAAAIGRMMWNDQQLS